MLENEDKDTEKLDKAIGANATASNDKHGSSVTKDEADTQGRGGRLVFDRSGRDPESRRRWRSLGGSRDGWNISVGAHT